MNRTFESRLEKMLESQRKRHRWTAVFIGMALVVGSGTTAFLTRSGVAMVGQERELHCAVAVHEHTESCYDAEEHEQPVCGYADYVIHHHGSSCRARDGTLVCQLPEISLHEHTEECYETVKELTCELAEDPGHVHTEECYEDIPDALICKNEDKDHEHGPECYAWEHKLVCGMEEGEGAHKHGESCYEEKKVLICTEPTELHTHTASCFAKEGDVDEEGNPIEPGTLICGKIELKEHVHDDLCFVFVTEPETSEETAPAESGPETEPAEDEDPVISVTKETAEDPGMTKSVEEGTEPVPEDSRPEGEPTEEPQEPRAPGESEGVAAEPFAPPEESGPQDPIGVSEGRLDEPETSEAEPEEPTEPEPVDIQPVAPEEPVLDEPEETEPAETEPEAPAEPVETEAETPAETEPVGPIGEHRESDPAAETKATVPTEETEAEDPTRETEAEDPTRESETEAPAEETDPAETEPEETEPIEAEPFSPAQQFTAQLDGLNILAEADEGAFPANTRMEVREVASEELPEPVSEMLPPNFQRLQTLEFQFFADDEEVQPLAKVRIVIRLEADDDLEAPLLISVDREGNVSILEQENPEDGSMIIFEFGPETRVQP